MWTRRLGLSLMAPTVLVCFTLVGVCVFATLYLNHLHIDSSEVVRENLRSTLAAARLETTTKELIRLLRSDRLHPNAVAAQNQNARQLLADAEELANLPRESDLVRQISLGMRVYLRQWEGTGDMPPLSVRIELANQLERDVLAPCVELRKFNATEVEKSDQANRNVVYTLQWGLLAVGLGAPIGGLLLGYRAARRLHHSIYQLSVHIRDAAGKLKRELGSVTVEEEGDLLHLHQQMQGIIEEIGRVVDQLHQRELEVLRAEHLAAVGQIAAGVAHELRNPLTSVKMLVQTGLEGKAPTGLEPDDLAIVEQEIRRMEKYIQTFINYARPPRSERRPFELDQVVQRALALVEARAHKQNVMMTADLPPAPVSLMIDPEQMQQVLVNLLINALDVLPRGGRIQVQMRRSTAGGPVELLVQDSGPGIAPRIQERLFEPFFSSKETGLGLGLSICKRLVEAHGGTISGGNAAAGGAVFTLTLPAEDKHADPAGSR